MGFLKDKSLGTIGEQTVNHLFTQHGFVCRRNEAKQKKELIEWDLEAVVGDKRLTLEVKYDLYCARSGNIAIEFYNPKQGKNSGLTATKADIWVHIINCPNSVWFTSVSALKQYTASSPAYKVIGVGGDDNSSMYLYKKDVIFSAIFTRVDELSKESFVDLLTKLQG